MGDGRWEMVDEDKEDADKGRLFPVDRVVVWV